MEQQRIAQQVVFYKPIGYRDIGCPRRRWEDTFYLFLIISMWTEQTF
jgi:hypothetical protein